MNKNSRIYVAGATGLVGSALVRKLKDQGYTNILTKRFELTDRKEVTALFREHAPEYVFLAAARVGGIGYNAANPAFMIYDNLAIQTNVIDLSMLFGVKKLVFLGTACSYPRITPQPIKEEYFLTGPFEPTNESYGIAKAAGIKMCQAYRKQYNFNAISLMVANIYGPGDDFRPGHAHVIPDMISKFVHAERVGAKSVTLYGDGSPTREFLYVDDLADACLFLMKEYDSPEIINVGSNYSISIKELAEKIKNVVGYDGDIIWDINRPNGTPLRKLDNTKLNELGWSAKIDFDVGLKKAYEWFVDNSTY